MKKLMNFFVLVMVIFFLFSCVNKRVSTTSSQKSYKPKETRLLTADMDDALKISFKKGFYWWGKGFNKEKGKVVIRGTRTWQWMSLDGVYIIHLVKNINNSFSKKHSGNIPLLTEVHKTIIKERYKKIIALKGMNKIYKEPTFIEGFIAGIPYIGHSSIVHYSEKHDFLAEKTTTLLFKNVKGERCFMSLIKINNYYPVDLVKEVKKYAWVSPK